MKELQLHINSAPCRVVPKCNSLHIMRTLHLRPEGVRLGLISVGPNLGYCGYPETTVAARDLASTHVYEMARRSYPRFGNPSTYLPSTSLAIVASCMFEVPS